MPRSYVTKFHANEGKANQLTINGAKSLSANNFIFCGSVKDLAILLPEAALSARARQRLSKNAYWTALCLDLCHSHAITDTDAMHVLNGATDDEIGPCVGKFMSPVQEGDHTLQASQWLTFIEEEVTEDSEVVAASLKKIKRQIKRVYPEALESLKLERIIVSPLLSGNGELKLNANQTLPELENVWIGSAAMNVQKSLVGGLLQSSLILASMGFDISTQLPHEEIAESTSAL